MFVLERAGERRTEWNVTRPKVRKGKRPRRTISFDRAPPTSQALFFAKRLIRFHCTLLLKALSSGTKLYVSEHS